MEIRQEEAEWAEFQAQCKQRGEPWMDADGVRHVPPKTNGPYVVPFEDRYDPDLAVWAANQPADEWYAGLASALCGVQGAEADD